MVALGGAVGAVLRFYVAQSIPAESFPWATLTVNLVGSLLLGSLTALAAAALIGEQQALLLGMGILGAFTTMSTFSLETATLLDDERWLSALGYLALTLVLGPMMAILGWKGTAHLIG